MGKTNKCENLLGIVVDDYEIDNIENIDKEVDKKEKKTKKSKGSKKPKEKKEIKMFFSDAYKGQIPVNREYHAYVFTWNNYPENYKDILSNIKCIKYLIVGEEISPTTNTPHLQGYVRYHGATAISAHLKKFPNCHSDISISTDKANDDYCRGIGENARLKGKQPNENVFTIGEISCGQGKRVDILKIKNKLMDGSRVSDLLCEATTDGEQRIIERMAKYFEPVRNHTTDFRFYWIYGPTEAGKTKYVIKTLYPDEYEKNQVYFCCEKSKWWDGYDGHPIIVIDDFRENFCSFSQLLKICQPVQMKVENKGSMRQLRAVQVVITTCKCPIYAYMGVGENRNQLYRRITHLFRFTENDCFVDETHVLKILVAKIKEKQRKNFVSIRDAIRDVYPDIAVDLGIDIPEGKEYPDFQFEDSEEIEESEESYITTDKDIEEDCRQIEDRLRRGMTHDE